MRSDTRTWCWGRDRTVFPTLQSYAENMASPTSYSLEPHGHFVQFYHSDEPLLNRNVGCFLWDGLLRGDALLVIATPERRESLSNHLLRLGADVPSIRARRQLSFLDARE